MYVCLVTVYFISTISNPLPLFLSVCLQVTHTKLLRHDRGTGRLPPSLAPLSVLSVKVYPLRLRCVNESVP